MNHLRSNVRTILCTAACLACGFGVRLATAQSGGLLKATPDAVVSDENAADNDAKFQVPDGSPAELLQFIEGIANPTKQIPPNEVQKYLENVSTAIGGAADKVLAAKASDQQMIDAIEWKVESLRIRGELGEADADSRTDEFLTSLKYNDRPAVAKAIGEIRDRQMVQQLVGKLRTWPRLDATQKSDTANRLVKAIKSGPINGAKAELLMSFGDMLGDTGNPQDSALAGRVMNDVLPLFAASTDPVIVRNLPMLEGIGRRLNLPGKKLELTGTYLSGKPLNWEAYRGKVVLVDFWATWCGPCRAEVPNVKQNYEKYHDKGFDVLAISLDKNRAEVEQYMAQSGLPWQTLFDAHSDGNGWEHPHEMAVKYGITGIPRAILVDQQGNVVSMNARGPRLAAELQKLLGEPGGKETSQLDSADNIKTVQRTTR
jgi:thiol-disulfide isomerase/thioredoxin